MNIYKKISGGVTILSLLVLGLTLPSTAFAVAATAPDLGVAASFSVFGYSMTADVSGATVSGDLGVNPGLTAGLNWTVGGSSYFGTGGLAGTAKTAATNAWNTMGSTGGTTWIVANTSPAPGLWTVASPSSATFDGTLTLDGSATDVWVFQIADSLTFTGTVNLTGGAQACNVFWRVASDATIYRGVAPSNTFVGTLIAGGAVSLIDGATVTGRMMALGAALTTAGATNITNPTCATAAAAASGGSTPREGSITVVKTVVNDSGGTKTIADFPLFINSSPVVSGVTQNFRAPSGPYTVTETNNANYVQTFSGDCDVNGRFSLDSDDHKFCIITNNDIGTSLAVVPPLIDVVKTASPLALPAGPGPVTYTYTLRNIGTVPVTNVTMVGDTCGPIVLVSGDINSDNKLNVNETWVHTCTKILPETHTNTVVATGWANGISAIDIASATVVVGASIVPPLIHVVKVPSRFTIPAPGGAVTYTYTVTNPGTAPLSNVSITDNKCTGLPGRVVGHPGDLNKNNLLESNESWSFTCQSNLTQTTINIGTAAGSANGLTARDFAVATVVVASPQLPNTGLPPRSGAMPWDIFISAGILMLLSTSLVVALRKR